MARGGVRAGAGRKATWKSGATKTVKLPMALVDAVVAYARQLDAGAPPVEKVTKSENPTPPPSSAGDQTRAPQLLPLINEKQALEKRVEALKGELAKSRRKLEMEEARTKGLEFRIKDAGSVLNAALNDHRSGARKGIRVKDVRSALLALGMDAVEAEESLF